MNISLHVLHIVDSLSLGGTERVAVNLVNALAEKGVDVHLCVTRKEGPLKQFLDERVHYLFLEKKGKIDFGCVRRLRKYIQKNHINVVHAHSSSLLLSIWARILLTFKIVWHIHNGALVNNSLVDNIVYRLLSRKVDFIYTVNDSLRKWCINELNISIETVAYLANFPDLKKIDELHAAMLPEGIRIVTLCNLHEPKDHHSLINAIALLRNIDDICLICIGRYNEQDKYFCSLMNRLKNLNLVERCIFLGQRNDVYNILKQCHIGILSSKSEGLPVSLLEYGLAGLPVICTSVGECPEVLGHGKYGLLVEPGDVEGLSNAMKRLIEDEEFRNELALKYQQHVLSNYSKEAIVESIMAVYEELIDE